MFPSPRLEVLDCVSSHESVSPQQKKQIKPCFPGQRSPQQPPGCRNAGTPRENSHRDTEPHFVEDDCSRRHMSKEARDALQKLEASLKETLSSLGDMPNGFGSPRAPLKSQHRLTTGLAKQIGDVFTNARYAVNICGPRHVDSVRFLDDVAALGQLCAASVGHYAAQAAELTAEKEQAKKSLECARAELAKLTTLRVEEQKATDGWRDMHRDMELQSKARQNTEREADAVCQTRAGLVGKGEASQRLRETQAELSRLREVAAQDMVAFSECRREADVSKALLASRTAENEQLHTRLRNLEEELGHLRRLFKDEIGHLRNSRHTGIDQNRVATLHPPVSPSGTSRTASPEKFVRARLTSASETYTPRSSTADDSQGRSRRHSGDYLIPRAHPVAKEMVPVRQVNKEGQTAASPVGQCAAAQAQSVRTDTPPIAACTATQPQAQAVAAIAAAAAVASAAAAAGAAASPCVAASSALSAPTPARRKSMPLAPAQQPCRRVSAGSAASPSGPCTTSAPPPVQRNSSGPLLGIAPAGGTTRTKSPPLQPLRSRQLQGISGGNCIFSAPLSSDLRPTSPPILRAPSSPSEMSQRGQAGSSPVRGLSLTIPQGDYPVSHPFAADLRHAASQPAAGLAQSIGGRDHTQTLPIFSPRRQSSATTAMPGQVATTVSKSSSMCAPMTVVGSAHIVTPRPASAGSARLAALAMGAPSPAPQQSARQQSLPFAAFSPVQSRPTSMTLRFGR